MLACLAWPPVAWVLSRPLEARYPIRPFDTASKYDALVVLSSAIEPPQFERPYPVPDEDTFHRILYAAWLYRERAVPILTCGGGGSATQESYALEMRYLLIQLGVPSHVVWTEERSVSTHENAVYGAEILKRAGIHRIALIVDATSMPRATACFTKEGIDVLPAPSDFYEPNEMLMPTWRALRQNEITLHELLGLAWYRSKHWI